MKFDHIWSVLTKKRPGLDDPDAKVEFTSGNLKKLLRQVYDHGEKSADAGGSFLDVLFGRGKK